MTPLEVTAGCRVTDEIMESRVLLGWCATFHHWKCRESFMSTETNRITCRNRLFTNNLVDRGLNIE